MCKGCIYTIYRIKRGLQEKARRIILWVKTLGRKRLIKWLFKNIDNYLYSVATRRIPKRVYFAVTSGLVGLAGKYGGWAAFAVFILATSAYERGRRLVSLDFVDAIKNLEKALSVPHRYKSYEFIYEINDKKEDRWIRYMEIIPPKTSMIAIKTLKFGAIGEGVSQVTRFEDLHIKAFTNKGEAYVLPTGQTDTKQILGTVILSVPIRPAKETPHPENTRTIYISGRWPNMWAPLRENGEDTGSVEMAHEAEELTISVIFPSACEQEEDIEMEAVKPSTINPGTISCERNKRGLWQCNWVIKNASVSLYKFRVRCKSLPQHTEEQEKKSSKVSI